jgi:hypothetical protein
LKDYAGHHEFAYISFPSALQLLLLKLVERVISNPTSSLNSVVQNSTTAMELSSSKASDRRCRKLCFCNEMLER